MRYYFAPMEGLTDSVYRRLHHKYFGGVDRYYMPFLSPTVHRWLTNREERELPYAQSEPFCAIPQLITKVPEDFIWAAGQCAERGYEEVNLNLGCPSGTVVAKGKGAGMLRDLDALRRFLDEIFAASSLPISVKTRLGMEDPAEFIPLLEIFNDYPMAELILHPRVRKQFYSGGIHEDMLRYAIENSKNPLCANGDILTKAAADAMPTQSVMIGRGLIADPGMLCGGTTIPALQAFMDELMESYCVVFGSSRNAMFRLKENWSMLLPRFEDSEKLGKQLRKTTDLAEYKAITAQIFSTLQLK